MMLAGRFRHWDQANIVASPVDVIVIFCSIDVGFVAVVHGGSIVAKGRIVL
jgi:hypothetical protein